MSKNIRIKRVYEQAEPTDGYRILVDRLWPRGITKDAARLDEWIKEIAPSAALRTWFGHKEERFAEFAERYKAELRQHTSELKRIKQLSKDKKVCLLYGAKNPDYNQAVVLLDVLNHMK